MKINLKSKYFYFHKLQGVVYSSKNCTIKDVQNRDSHVFIYLMAHSSHTLKFCSCFLHLGTEELNKFVIIFMRDHSVTVFKYHWKLPCDSTVPWNEVFVNCYIFYFLRLFLYINCL